MQRRVRDKRGEQGAKDRREEEASESKGEEAALDSFPNYTLQLFFSVSS